MARPKANIDWNKVNEYLNAQCDGVSIAGILGIAPETLYRSCKEMNKIGFDAYSQKKKAEGLELLRDKQFRTALKGNVIMQIWLGKQYLNQKDKSDLTSGNEKIQPLNITVVEKSTTEKLQKLINEPMPN
jgi:hypothetical protein